MQHSSRQLPTLKLMPQTTAPSLAYPVCSLAWHRVQLVRCIPKLQWRMSCFEAPAAKLPPVLRCIICVFAVFSCARCKRDVGCQACSVHHAAYHTKLGQTRVTTKPLIDGWKQRAETACTHRRRSRQRRVRAGAAARGAVLHRIVFFRSQPLTDLHTDRYSSDVFS